MYSPWFVALFLIPIGILTTVLLLGFFVLLPGGAAIAAVDCISDGKCSILFVRGGHASTSYFEGAWAYVVAILWAALSYLVAWIAVSRSIRFAGFLKRKNDRENISDTRNPMIHLATVVFVAADTLLFYWLDKVLR